MRFLVRLAVFALAGYGVKALYDRYASHSELLIQPAQEFVDRAKNAVAASANTANDAAREMSGALHDTADEIRNAADDAANETARRLTAVTNEAERRSANESGTKTDAPPNAHLTRLADPGRFSRDVRGRSWSVV